jgi:hypothetical protein
MSKIRRKKNKETKRRFEAIKDLMSTFAMSTVAVVAAVTLIPTSPKAEIIKAVSLNEEIIYQVNVTDEDNALDLSTLSVVVENQLEYYEQSISLGENSGYFDSLSYDTEYRLSVYGSKGFGQERLDTVMVITKEKVGGTILSVSNPNPEDTTNYIVDVSINDPNTNYSSINLYYGYTWEYETEIEYSSIEVTSPRMTVELFEIYTSEPIHIYIEATTLDGTEVLDEIWVTPPFEFYSSVYMSYINSKEVGFYVYSDMNAENISYKMNVYNNNLLVRTETLVLGISDDEEYHYGNNEIIIDKLLPSTTYDYECIAIYTNPLTLRTEQEIIYEEEITTLDTYSYAYNVEEFDEYFEITIVVDDPNHYFQNVYYESNDTSGEYDMYLYSEMLDFTLNEFDKSVTFTIFKPSASSYQITIDMRSQTDSSIKQMIDIIIYE